MAVIPWCRNRKERQRTVFNDSDPLSIKERQSLYFLKTDTWTSVRNRSMSLAQLFTLARLDEMVKWRISDLHVMTIPRSYPSLGGNSDISLLCIEQSSSKTLKVRERRTYCLKRIFSRI